MPRYCTKDGRSCTADEALDASGALRDGYRIFGIMYDGRPSWGVRPVTVMDAAPKAPAMIRDNGQDAYERNLRTAHLSDDGQGLAAAVHAERMLIDSEARQAALYADACARAFASRPDEQALADSRRAYNDRISNAYKG